MPQLAEGPSIVTQDLVFYTDFKNRKCYPGTGTTVNDLSKINGSSIESFNTAFGKDYLSKADFSSQRYIKFTKKYTQNLNELTCTIMVSQPAFFSGWSILSSYVNQEQQLGWAVFGEYYPGVADRILTLFINSDPNVSPSNYIYNSYNLKQSITPSLDVENVFIFTFIFKKLTPTSNFVIKAFYNDKEVTNNLINSGATTFSYNLYSHNTIAVGEDVFIDQPNIITDRIYGGMIYNRALTDDEVLQNHKALRGRYQELWQ